MIAVTLIRSQTVSETERTALEQLNRRVIEAASAGNLGDAADSARQMLEMSVKLYGDNDTATALAYYNLGEIYRAKKDYKKSIENLEKALEIYRQHGEKFAAKIANTALGLGICYGFERNEYKAEQYLLTAVDAAKKSYGTSNKVILPFLVNLRNFYIFSGNYDKADQQFTEHYTIAVKIFDTESEELEEIEEAHYCFATRFFSEDTAKHRIKRFRNLVWETKKSQEVPTFDFFADHDPGIKAEDKEIIPPKPIKLAKPSYPKNAGLKGIGGKIPVKIKIDETGKIIKAETFCGNSDLAGAAKKAALKSKFKPTLVNGKPIVTNGYIVYIFDPTRRR